MFFKKFLQVHVLEKVCFKISKILDLENVICISAKILSMMELRMKGPFFEISMYLFNKNILEYAQISRSGLKSMILDIEGHSRGYESK